MADLYQVIGSEINDEEKTIEVSKKVDQKEQFTIRMLRQQILNIDIQIENLRLKKQELKARIDEAKAQLNLNVA